MSASPSDYPSAWLSSLYHPPIDESITGLTKPYHFASAYASMIPISLVYFRDGKKLRSSPLFLLHFLLVKNFNLIAKTLIKLFSVAIPYRG